LWSTTRSTRNHAKCRTSTILDIFIEQETEEIHQIVKCCVLGTKIHHVIQIWSNVQVNKVARKIDPADKFFCPNMIKILNNIKIKLGWEQVE
jgi:hypothetical protein